jgi:hypothetical protein
MYNLDRGLLTRFQRGFVRDDVAHKLTSKIVCYVPATTDCTAVGCGFDNFTYSAKNPACTVCSGKGKITTWSTARLTVRISWVDPARLTFVRGVPTGEVGDVILQAPYHDRDLFETILELDNAYVLVDDKHVKPISVTVDRVEAPTTILVPCKLVNESDT